jgi:transcriptional regulator with XRE-family HTH domain
MVGEQQVRLDVDLIHDVMDALDLSSYALSHRSGISKGQVSKFLNRRTKNVDGVKIGTAAAIANALGLSLGAVIRSADGQWHRLDPKDEAQLFWFLQLISNSGCLLTASESADSHILPDGICEAIEWARLNQPEFTPTRRQQLFELHKQTMAWRQRARQEGTHLTQVMAPSYIWGERLRQAESEFETMKKRVREFRELTAVGFVSAEKWHAVRASITNVIRFDGWSKINVGGHLILAVWYHAEVFYTTERTAVSRVRAILEDAGREVGLPPFRARGAKIESAAMKTCCRKAVRIIDNVFTGGR